MKEIDIETEMIKEMAERGLPKVLCYQVLEEKKTVEAYNLLMKNKNLTPQQLIDKLDLDYVLTPKR